MEWWEVMDIQLDIESKGFVKERVGILGNGMDKILKNQDKKIKI